MYDLKKKFNVSRDVQFFDHFHEKAKSDDASQADLTFVYPDMNQENESVPVPLLPEAPKVQEIVEPVVQDNVKPAVQENVEHAPVQNVEGPSPQKVETVGAPPRECVNEEPVRRT